MELKVSKTTDPGKLAGAIASYTKEGKDIELLAIGAGAVNQTVKAMAIARSFVIARGLDIKFTASFKTVNIDNKEKTAIVFNLERK